MFKSLCCEINLSEFIYLYDINTFRRFQCVGAKKLSKKLNIDVEKAFFIKNLVKPNEYDIECINKDIMTFDINDNDIAYVTQSIYGKYGNIPISTKMISETYRDVMKCDIDYDDLHKIGRGIRYKFYKIFSDVGYNLINVWQLISVSSVINRNNIIANENSIVSLFNKIYKRNPIKEEISIISSLNLDSGIEGIRNEIVRYFKVESELSFRRRRIKKH
jgi:hypothetical protein